MLIRFGVQSTTKFHMLRLKSSRQGTQETSATQDGALDETMVGKTSPLSQDWFHRGPVTLHNDLYLFVFAHDTHIVRVNTCANVIGSFQIFSVYVVTHRSDRRKGLYSVNCTGRLLGDVGSLVVTGHHASPCHACIAVMRPKTAAISGSPLKQV